MGTIGNITSSNYATEYNKMLKSVYENKGFWVARYEAGIETERTSSSDTIASTLKPLSKAGKSVLNYVTCSQAQTLASRLTTTNYTSSLMFGVQWDLVLAFIASNLGENVIDSNGKNILTEDSTSWGRYSGEAGLKVTGAIENDTKEYKKCNIYDLAGNVWEWTLEYAYNSDKPCAFRGGVFYIGGDSLPAAHRTGTTTSNANDKFGFHVSLY